MSSAIVRSACMLLLAYTLPNSTMALNVYATLLNPSACGAATGAIEIQVQGGTGQYTFVWSNGSTTANIYNLFPGTYSITVSDANAEEATGTWEVGVSILSPPPSAQDGHCSCNGSMSGQVQIIEWGIVGTPPYTYNPPPDGIDAQGDPYFVFFGMPAGTMVAIEITDANGCAGISYQTILGPRPPDGPNMQVLSTTGSCTNTYGGSVTLGNVNDTEFFLNPYPQVTIFDANEVFVTGASGVDHTFTGLAPGAYTAVRDWDPTDYLMAYPCDGNPNDVISFTIDDLGNNCGSLSGSVFIDNDEDCDQDPTEVGVPYQVLTIEPGAQWVITDTDGNFARDLPSGDYSLSQTDPLLVQLCPTGSPISFTMGAAPVILDIADSSAVLLDLSAQLTSTAMRPGFAGTYWGWVRNLSPQVSGPVTVNLVLDPGLILSSALPLPTSIIGNTLTWELPPFTALHDLHLTVNVSVPVSATLGTPVSTSLSVINTLTDASSANNSATSNTVITGSYDPNDKTARTSTEASNNSYLIDQDEWIDYLIRFQNTGTDTAFTVVVTDTLSEVLDMASFQQGPASHAFQVAFKADRVVEWTFAEILLPDSNVNEAASHGSVSFRIKPVPSLMPSTVIENIANIYFDFNPPVITGPSVLVAEFSTEVMEQGVQHLSIHPNPALDQLFVQWDRKNVIGSTWDIITADGRALRSAAMNGPNAVIDVSDLSNGTYMLRVMNTNGMDVRPFVISGH